MGCNRYWSHCRVNSNGKSRVNHRDRAKIGKNLSNRPKKEVNDEEKIRIRAFGSYNSKNNPEFQYFQGDSRKKGAI